MQNRKEMSEDKPLDRAVFAGGCFWHTEAAFEEVDGVVSAVSGYTGGHVENPMYEQVSSGLTGHYEAVEVTYDPSVISYEQLLDIFWRNIDPIDQFGQFYDKGSQYKTAIFYQNEAQRKLAEESKKKLQESGGFDKPIATAILPASKFYKAEEYHQDYYKKSATRYQAYKKGAGFEEKLDRIWKGKRGA